MKDIPPLDAFQRRMLEEANKVVAEVDGKPFTGLDKLMLQLKASDRPEDRKLLLTHFQNTLQADHAWREKAVVELIAYKEHWGPIFTNHRLLGRKCPEVYPDPDDIVILSSTEFRFLGPVTANEAARWEFFKRGRNAFFLVAEEIIESAGQYRPLEVDRQHYLRVRRQFYRVNRHLPKEFKKKYPARFPAFKPPAEPPDWYLGNDEQLDPETNE